MDPLSMLTMLATCDHARLPWATLHVLYHRLTENSGPCSLSLRLLHRILETSCVEFLTFELEFSV